jgi:hypothetical protein
MQKNCSKCGSEFNCGFTEAAAGAAEEFSCWCAELPHVSPLSPNEDCLCPECLRKSIANRLEGESAKTT